MAQSLSDIVIHIVFSTKDRQQPWIDADIEQELFQYLCGTARGIKCPVIKINVLKITFIFYYIWEGL